MIQAAAMLLRCIAFPDRSDSSWRCVGADAKDRLACGNQTQQANPAQSSLVKVTMQSLLELLDLSSRCIGNPMRSIFSVAGAAYIDTAHVRKKDGPRLKEPDVPASNSSSHQASSNKAQKPISTRR